MPVGSRKGGLARSDVSVQSDGEDDDGQRDNESVGDVEGSVSRRPSSIGTTSRRSRSRVHFSCTECHRRKQKCNRETPCQHCIARKIPERCKTFQPGEDPNDLGARVSRIERTMHDNFDRLFTMLRGNTGNDSDNDNRSGRARPAASSAAAPDGVSSWRTQTLAAHNGQPALEDISAAAAAPAVQETRNADGSEAGDEVDAPITARTGAPRGNLYARVNSLISDSVDHRTGRLVDPVVLTDPMNHIEQAAQLDVVMHEYGATYSISQVLMAALPPREVCDALVDHFFETHNWLRQPMSRRRLMLVYEAFWRSGGSLTVNNVNVYSTFMMAAAIGALTYRGPLQVSENARVIHLTAKRLFFAARHSLLISVMLGREDIQQVIAFHLASRYLFLDRRISEAWSCVSNAVKTAHSIGLHRDGSLLNLPKEECEARRRIWSIIYFAERVLCMNLGRPSAIDDCSVDTQLISDEDETGDFEEYMKVLPGAIVPSGERPRFLTHTLFRHRLAVIMGQTIAIYQNVQNPAHYSDVVSIEHSLEAFHKSYPDHLRTEFDAKGELHHVDTKWDHIYEFVAVHRYQQQAELLFVRMSLHRPYLIRPTAKRQRSSAHGATSSSTSKAQHHRYNLSRRSCVEAAYQTLMLRKDLSDIIRARLKQGEGAPAWISHLGTYNTLSAIVVLGIYLLMEPHADNADMLLRPLRLFYDSFLNSWQKSHSHQFNDVKEREFTILRMFLERIDQARSSRDSSLKRRRGNEMIGSDAPDKRKSRTGKIDNGNSVGSEDTAEHTVLVDSPQQSKEADTVGVLLDLNQADARRSSVPQQTYADFAGSRPSQGGASAAFHGQRSTDESNATNGAADDGSLPWPYLPIRTPHHPGSTSNGLTGSPHTVHSSGSASQATPPPLRTGSGKGAARTGSGDDVLPDGASVHQLFDSWFRYNAFENVDMGMHTNNGGSSGAIELGTDNRDSTAIAQPTGLDTSKLSLMLDSNVSGALPGVNTGANAASGVLWSTVPAPMHSQPSGTSTSIKQQTGTGTGGVGAGTNSASIASFSNADFDSALMGMGIPPGPRDTFIEATGLQNLTTDSQPAPASMSAASYDPTFWQSLMDKISE